MLPKIPKTPKWEIPWEFRRVPEIFTRKNVISCIDNFLSDTNQASCQSTRRRRQLNFAGRMFKSRIASCFRRVDGLLKPRWKLHAARRGTPSGDYSRTKRPPLPTNSTVAACCVCGASGATIAFLKSSKSISAGSTLTLLELSPLAT